MTLVIPDEDKDKFPEGYPDSPFARTTAFPDQGDSYRGASFPSSVGDIMWASACLLYTSPSPRDRTRSRMPSSA